MYEKKKRQSAKTCELMAPLQSCDSHLITFFLLFLCHSKRSPLLFNSLTISYPKKSHVTSLINNVPFFEHLLTIFALVLSHMKDLSFFFLKNFMSSKVRRSFRNGVCNDDNSTSTLNQKQPSSAPPSQQPSSSYYLDNNDQITMNVPPRKSVTLEEMILQLELEEEIARKEKAATLRYTQDINFHRRMSCVNNSDILRSARNALNQYPRFSLDGRDAMYRSSFCKHNLRPSAIDGLKLGRLLHLPHSVGGENVIWCKPGVVPKLMGLEAMPLPISRLYSSKISSCNRETKKKVCNAIRNQNLKRMEKNDQLERRKQMRQAKDSNVSCEDIKIFGRCRGGCASVDDGGGGSHSSSSVGYGVINPLAVEHVCGLGAPISWPPPYI